MNVGNITVNIKVEIISDYYGIKTMAILIGEKLTDIIAVEG